MTRNDAFLTVECIWLGWLAFIPNEQPSYKIATGLIAGCILYLVLRIATTDYEPWSTTNFLAQISSRLV